MDSYLDLEEISKKLDRLKELGSKTNLDNDVEEIIKIFSEIKKSNLIINLNSLKEKAITIEEKTKNSAITISLTNCCLSNEENCMEYLVLLTE